MNQNQIYFLEKNDLSIQMMLALRTLVEGSRLPYLNRSYKALHHRNLATADFAVTPNGLATYESYYGLAESEREKLIAQRKTGIASRAIALQASTCPTCGQITTESKFVVKPNSPTAPALDPIDSKYLENELKVVVERWQNLPDELRKLIVEAASRYETG